MLFNSYQFLFIFLPVTFAGFFVLSRFKQAPATIWLGLASLVFYGWWSPKYVSLLLASIFFNYCSGYLIGRMEVRSKMLLGVAIGTNLCLLGYFKYVNFFIESVNTSGLASLPLLEVVLPLGISFFTFTQIAYLIDVHRKIAEEYNFGDYLLFVTYFPHLIAGPVLHHRQMMPQFADGKTYRLQPECIAMGLSFFAVGLAKKILLADNFAEYSDPVFSAAGNGVQPDFIEAWTGTLAFALQLYFDFSAYCDMAIGISLLFGITLPINFNSPYKASSIIDFWRRWHMTLSQFLRDYLYVPLGGNKRGAGRRYVNLFVTMLLGGLWHGANWTFVVWGALHGIFLLVNHAWRNIVGEWLPSRPVGRLIYTGTAVLLTFICVLVAWIFFRSNSLAAAMLVLKGFSGFGGVSFPSAIGLLVENLGPLKQYLPLGVSFGGVFVNVPAMGAMGGIAPFVKLLTVGLLIVWVAPNSQQLFGYAGYERFEARFFKRKMTWQMSPKFGIFLGCIFFLAASKMNKVSPFLYYQF